MFINERFSKTFFCKLILNRVTAVRCFENLRRHEEVNYCTYRKAAIAKGLTKASEEAIAVLEEAVSIDSPQS